MEKLNDHIKEAHLKGYRINNEGEAISPYGKKIHCNISSSGYKKFTIRSSIWGQRVTITVHRLAAYQKYGDRIFQDGIQVRHLDGNPSNNKPSNLELGTQSENMMDIPEDTRKKSAIHASKFRIKHDANKIKLMKQDREAGMNYSELMNKYGITSKGTLSYIINHR